MITDARVKQTVLVFPIDLDASRGFIQVARSLGARIIGASSVSQSNKCTNVDHFIHLPFITDSEFLSTLSHSIKAFDISHIFAPHIGVWTLLNNILSGDSEVLYPELSEVKLCRPSPYSTEFDKFKEDYRWADEFAENPMAEKVPDNGKSPCRPTLSREQYASLHRQYTAILGECDSAKLSALADVFRLAPFGDIIEIGAFFGRSAYALGWLAQQYKIGNVICIDPWDTARKKSQGGASAVIEEKVEKIDSSKVFEAFKANLASLNNVGFIKNISTSAVKEYRMAVNKGVLDCPGMGKRRVSGEVSLLHIDGNHAYEFVQQDIACWVPQVKTGGWILVDDYVWSFGDGPKRAGDELLSSPEVEFAFTASDTLFLRKR